jgi:ComF family protein
MKRNPGCNAGTEHVPTSVHALSNSVRYLTPVLSRLSAVLLPQDCFVCGAAAGPDTLCAACAAALPWQTADACPVCALPTAGGLTCGACLAHPPAYDATRAAFIYGFPVDRMVQALKYHHRLALARYLGAVLAGMRVNADVLLPMPLHARRLRARGFNQAVELARPLAALWGVPLALDLVRRTRDLPAQAGLTRKARLANLRGGFSCEQRLDGLCVAVVDDVMTTGASLEELARTLKRQGARRVENYIVARTP